MYQPGNLRNGMQVFSSDGQQIGTIKEVGETHFRCDSGFLGLGRDLYIPFDNVERVQGNQLFLNVARDRMNQMNFDRQPAGWMR